MTRREIPVVCCFESRRAGVMRDLIVRAGGQPLIAPSMREQSIQDNPAGIAALKRILSGDVTHLVLLTGVGTEALLQLAESQNAKDELLQVMRRIPLLARGPKPAAVLQRLGLTCAAKAPEPNTSADLIDAIRAADIDLRGGLVAVQEYGQPSPELYESLRKLGADVLPVPVYRWALPEDTEPLKQAIRAVAAGEVDVVLFTSAQQIQHVFQVADDLRLADDFRNQASRLLVASIGPTCSESVRRAGLTVNLEASPPKMGVLVRCAVLKYRD